MQKCLTFMDLKYSSQDFVKPQKNFVQSLNFGMVTFQNSASRKNLGLKSLACVNILTCCMLVNEISDDI